MVRLTPFDAEVASTSARSPAVVTLPAESAVGDQLGRTAVVIVWALWLMFPDAVYLSAFTPLGSGFEFATGNTRLDDVALTDALVVPVVPRDETPIATPSTARP